MADVIVHSFLGSPYGRSVLATLKEKGAPWHLAPLRAPDHKQAPHLERQPFGRAPAIEHGDFRLYETQAILRYLDRVLPTPPLTPADPRGAALMDLVMNVNDWYLFQGVGDVIGFHRVVSPRVFGGVPDEGAIAAAMPKAHTVFRELGRLLGDKPFMAGHALSLADLHLAPQMAMMALTPEWATLTASHPNLVAWLERMEARPSFVATTWERLMAHARALGRPVPAPSRHPVAALG